MKHLRWAVALAAVASVLCIASPAQAATKHVPCDEEDLVEAITAANTNAEPDTLLLAENCVYAFEKAFGGESALPPIQPDGGALTINGRGAKIVRAVDDDDV